MAILNGQLPSSLLAAVPWDTAERLRPGALADLLRLNVAFRARFDHNLVITDSYRPLARQKDYYAHPPSGAGTAAKPGTSNHGWGLALDLHLTTAEYAWMRTNAPRFGWVNPLWAHDGRGVEEPWHWEHMTAESVIPDVITPTTTPTRRHTMRVIRGIERPEVWVTDGITKRHIRTSTEAGELLRICDQTEPLIIGQFACDAIPTHTPTEAVDVTALAAAIATALPDGSALTTAQIVDEIDRRDRARPRL